MLDWRSCNVPHKGTDAFEDSDKNTSKLNQLTSIIECEATAIIIIYNDSNEKILKFKLKTPKWTLPFNGRLIHGILAYEDLHYVPEMTKSFCEINHDPQQL